MERLLRWNTQSPHCMWRHILVVGHSSCGGVKGCHDLCAGTAPQLEEKSSFVGRWVELLRPGYERVKDIADENERIRALEHEAVLVSFENLMTFPFVKEAVNDGRLTLHGLWNDIASGALEQYDPVSAAFRAYLTCAGNHRKAAARTGPVRPSAIPDSQASRLFGRRSGPLPCAGCR